MPGSGEYGFSGEKGPHEKASYNSIANAVNKKSLSRSKKNASLEKYIKEKEQKLQIFYNKTGRLAPLVRASMNPREILPFNKKNSRLSFLSGNTGINVGGTRKRYKKRRVSRKVKKTYRKRR